MFVPKLFISVGETGAFFTLRETYEHTVYVPGEGAWGNSVMNGVYQGSCYKEIRSFHHFNLSQDPDEAFEKAMASACAMGLELTSSREDLAEQLRDIKRANAEEMERRAQLSAKLQQEHAEAEREKFEGMVKQLADGVVPFGRYAGVKLTELPVSYINWLMNTTFESGWMDELSKAVKSQCADKKLPTPNMEYLDARVGDRVECKVTVVRKGAFEGYYGMVYFVTFVTENGVCLVSKGSFNKCNVGDKLTIKCTVKDFSNYKEQHQTVINRVKVI